MTVEQATAEVFLTAFRALSRREQEDILGRIACDRRFRRAHSVGISRSMSAESGVSSRRLDEVHR